MRLGSIFDNVEVMSRYYFVQAVEISALPK